MDNSDINTMVNIKNNDLKGLHRPFNKPLKSLTWVCLFLSSKYTGNKSSIYLDFYKYLLKELHRRKNLINYFQEGYISPSNVEKVLQIIRHKNINDYIRKVLIHRQNDDDKIIYSTYKNTCYYLTLSKKLGLITIDYKLTLNGEYLKKANRNFLKLGDDEKKIIFRILLESNYKIILPLLIIKKDIEKGKISDERAIKYLKDSGLLLEEKYIRSFKRNYLNVIFSWFDQLDLLTDNGKLRKKWSVFFKSLPESFNSLYESEFSRYQNFKNKDLIHEKNLNINYEKLLISYENLKKLGRSSMGYVNLYDIMINMHMSYTKFNNILNSFYDNYRTISIILFSNIVSSVDKRRRFIINKGNDKVAVLKIKIIKHNKNGNR